MARKDSKTHKQESLPEKVEAPLNIEATPFGSVLKSGELSSPNFRQRRSGWRVQSDGTAEFRNVSASGTFSIGGTTKTISSVLEIQDSLNEISASGGGQLYLNPGTYTLTEDLVIPDGVALLGVSRDATIIDCNSSYKVTMSGSDSYNIGTCSVNDGATTVTGLGTSWDSTMAGQCIYLGGYWYVIDSITSTTELELVDAYAGSNLSGYAYTIATPNFNPTIGKLTIQNATGVALEVHYASEPNFNDIYVLDSGTGIDADYVYAPNAFVGVFGCTTGANYNYVSAFKFDYVAFEQNTGVGVVMTNCTGSTFFDSSVSLNGGDGINLTDCTNIVFASMDVSLNGGQGIEMISGNADLQFIGVTTDGNTSDGYKLTATTDRVSISTCSIVNNGGYGINIAAATCDDNYIIAPSFDNNTSGNINDSGTSTVIIRSTDPVEFGGNGDDGPLTVSSGTTTIDLGGNMFVTKNYSSISITGTGKVAFSNPHANGTVVFFKSSGNVTLTSSEAPMLDLRGVGADVATDGITFWLNAPVKGTNGSGATGGTGGTQATPYFNNYNYYAGITSFTTGSGSGTGGTGVSGDGGAGGAGKRGGGAMILECAGAFNFTTAGGISVAGQNGDVGSSGGATPGSGGGGGGGGSAGGSFIGIYKTLTANSGTVTVSGGTGGTGGTGTSGAIGTGGGGGGGGASHIGAGTNGTNGSSGTNGGSAGTGGNGANGSSFIGLKTA